MKDTASQSQGSVLVVEEEVQAKVVSSEGGKGKKAKEMIKDEVQQELVSVNGGKKNYENECEGYLISVGSYA